MSTTNRDQSTCDPLGEPWRKSKKWSTRLMQELKDSIDMYRPLSEVKIPYINVLLVGQVGAGKSSIFNTINSIFRGYVTSQACSGSSEHSVTTHYRMYSVRNGGAEDNLNFRLCDTRGIEEDQGLEFYEISYLLDGNVPDKYMFNPSVPISPVRAEFISSPKLKDQIHVVAFVVDASTVDVFSEKVLERMKSFQIRMNQKGIPQVVLLTKIDQISEPLKHDISKVFYMPIIQEYVEKVSQMMGLPRAHVLPVKNYESEMDLDENINILSLLTMQQILHFADDYLHNFLVNNEDDDNILGRRFPSFLRSRRSRRYILHRCIHSLRFWKDQAEEKNKGSVAVNHVIGDDIFEDLCLKTLVAIVFITIVCLLFGYLWKHIN